MSGKKFMFVMRKAPHGTIYSYEGLEVVLITASYDQDISMAFIDDGVFALKKGQDTSGIGIKGFLPTYDVLGDYDVHKLYVDVDSMNDRGLTKDDLVDLVYEDDEDEDNPKEIKLIQFLSRKEIMAKMSEQDVLLPY